MANGSDNLLPKHLAHVTSLIGLDSITAAHMQAEFEGGLPVVPQPSELPDLSHIPSAVIEHLGRRLTPGQGLINLDPSTTITIDHFRAEYQRRGFGSSDTNRP